MAFSTASQACMAFSMSRVHTKHFVASTGVRRGALMKKFKKPFWLYLLLLVAIFIPVIAAPWLPETSQVQAQSSTPPILIVVNDSGSAKFGRYLGEILRAEGLNSYEIINIASLNPADLTNHNLTILAYTG